MKRKNREPRESGAITIMTAILLTVLISFTAIAVDLGLHYYKGAKLQNALDSAATAVAAELGAMDQDLYYTAYEYMELNGFDEDEVEINIEKKGVVNLETVIDETYITTGYYKLSAELTNNTLFGAIMDIDALHITATSWVRCEANYVKVPRALKYTVFAGSRNGTNENPAIRMDGRTSDFTNSFVNFFQSAINWANTNIVQRISSWWNGTDMDYRQLVNINLSEIVANGDVHSNSNISVGVQALNVSRAKDRDYTGTTYDDNGNETDQITDDNQEAYDNITPDTENSYDDYGQVTFTAVTDILFNHSLKYSDGRSTHLYVQNQQFLEQTAVALKILDSVEFVKQESNDSFTQMISNNAELKSAYLDACDKYFATTAYSIPDVQKEAIRAQADNLEFNSALGYTLKNQHQLVYNVNQAQGESILKYVRENGFDSIYNAIDEVGVDYFNSDGTNDTNNLLYRKYADSNDTFNYGISFTKDVTSNLDKYDETYVSPTAYLNVTGTKVDRNYAKVKSEGNRTVTPQLTAGVNYAVAVSFQQDSDVIPVPNLKPYFVRQINKSVRDATKTREKLTSTSAGAKTVPLAVHAQRDRYQQLVNQTKYFDISTFADGTAYTNVAYDANGKLSSVTANTAAYTKQASSLLFTTEIKSDLSGVTKYDATSDFHRKFANIYIFKSNGDLKTPTELITEYESVNNSKYGKNAIASYKTTTVNSELDKVETKKTSVKTGLNNTYKSYDLRGDNTSTSNKSVYEAVEELYAPNITDEQGQTGEQVSAGTIPQPKDVFLGYGVTGTGVTIQRDGVRAGFDNFIRDLGVTVNNDVFTAPALPAIATSGGSGDFGGKGSYSSDQYMEAKTYKSASTPFTTNWLQVVTGRYNIRVNKNSAVTGDVYVDNGIGLYVHSGGTLKIGGKLYTKGGENSSINVASGGYLYVKGNFETDDEYTKIDVSGYMQVGGTILSKKYLTDDTMEDYIVVRNGGVLVVNGNIDFGMQDHITVENGGTLIVQGYCKAAGHGAGYIDVSGTLIQLSSGNTIDSNYIKVYSGGVIGSVGGLNSDHQIYVEGSTTDTNAQGGWIYTLGNIKGNNGGTGDNVIEIKGNNCQIYVTGCITSDKTNRHIYIHDGSGTVLSVLGQNASDCFDGKVNELCSNQTNTNFYFGKATTIAGGTANTYYSGNMYCFGNFTVNGSSNPAIQMNNQSTASGGVSYIAQNFTVGSTVNAYRGHTIYVSGAYNVGNLFLDNASKTHGGTTINVSGTLTLNTAGVMVEGANGVFYGTLVNNGGTIVEVAGVDFNQANINANGISRVYNGNIDKTSLTMKNAKIRTGNIKLSGDLVLKCSATNTPTILVVNGNLECNAIKIDNTSGNSEKVAIYVKGNVTCNGKLSGTDNAIRMDGGGMLIVRNDVLSTDSHNAITKAFANKDITCKTGCIDVLGGSKVYADGKIEAAGYGAAGSSEIYGYDATSLNATNNYNGSGLLNCYYTADQYSEIYCGENTTTKSTANGSYIGIVENGYFFFPNKAVFVSQFSIGGTGYAVFDGKDAITNVTIVSGYVGTPAEIKKENGKKGKFVNYGRTKFSGTKFVNAGELYMLGGTDLGGATTNNMSGGGEQSNPDYFTWNNGSETYIGVPYNGNTQLTTLTFNSNYEGRGNIYIDASVLVRGYVKDKHSDGVLGVGASEDGGKDMQGNNGIRAGHVGFAVYIPNGTTYVTGSFQTYDSTHDNAVIIGYMNGSSPGTQTSGTYAAGLVIGGNLTLEAPLFNYGTCFINGEYVLNNLSGFYTTDKGFKGGADEGQQIVNGYATGTTVRPRFYVGGTSTVRLVGYTYNYGDYYFNPEMSIVGSNNAYREDLYKPAAAMVTLMSPFISNFNARVTDGRRFAFVNYENSTAHFGGTLYCNSHRFDNRKGAVLGVEGSMYYGSCGYNCGKLYVKGDFYNYNYDKNGRLITENSTYPHYRDEGGVALNAGSSYTVSFSFMNGIYKIDEDCVAGKEYTTDAEFYCGGSFRMGDRPYNGNKDSSGNGGSIMNLGTMYVREDMGVYTFDETFTQNLVAGVFGRKNSYYYTAMWMYNNTKTIVGGDIYAGAGVAIGSGSMFMAGGEYQSARATKLNINSYFSKSSAVGVGNHASYNDTDNFKNAYFYVGKNCIINSFGRTNWEPGSTFSSDAPGNGTRDFDVYSNTNMYIGGSLFCNCKVYLKKNVTCLVEGKYELYKPISGIWSFLGNIIEAYTNPLARAALTDLLGDSSFRSADYRCFIYQSLDENISTRFVVNGSMYVNDTAKIRDMSKTYVYGDFYCGEYFELGKSLDEGEGNDSSWAMKEGFRDSGDNDRTYYYKNAGYMYVDGNFRSKKYSRIYASTTLKIRGSMDVGSIGGLLGAKAYLTLRHDAKLYVGKDCRAYSSIDGGQYCDIFVNGDMTATTSTIKLRDQSTVTVNGNMLALSYVELGKYDPATARGAKIQVNEGGDPVYDGDNAEQSAEGSEQGEDPYGGNEGNAQDVVTLDTVEELKADTQDDQAIGCEMYISGVLASITSYIKEFAFGSVMVGKYVWAPKYLTLRHNSDLWVIPEAFNNITYVQQPYVSISNGSLISSILDAINHTIYTIKEGVTPDNGSVYTFGSLTLNRNASLICTYDCQVMGQCVLRPDTLVYAWHNFSCYAPSLNLSLDTIRGNTSLTGFDSYGDTDTAYEYICTNQSEHDGYYYAMHTPSRYTGTGTIKCDVCGSTEHIKKRKDGTYYYKKVQISRPAVVYAYNELNIYSTIDMRLTYLICERGDVNLGNLYTKTENAEKNAKELPNAIASYYGNINYFAMYGKLGALFYAPNKNVDFDGYYSEIWGCVLGDTVTMNTYYMAFHRFTNWRTMNLHIAESSNIYLISQREYDDAADNIDDIYMYDPNSVVEEHPNFMRIFGFSD